MHGPVRHGECRVFDCPWEGTEACTLVSRLRWRLLRFRCGARLRGLAPLLCAWTARGRAAGASERSTNPFTSGRRLDNPSPRPAPKEKLDWRHSIVDLMKLLDLDSNLAARKTLAGELHYTGNTDNSATMNVWLHKQVMAKLAENGGKVPDELKH